MQRKSFSTNILYMSLDKIFQESVRHSITSAVPMQRVSESVRHSITSTISMQRVSDTVSLVQF